METLREDLARSAAEVLERLDSAGRLLRPEAGARFPDEVWDQAMAAGWAQVLLPEAAGGLGLGLEELGAVFKAAGRGPVRGPLIDTAVVLPLAVAAAPAMAGSVAAALEGKEIAAWVHGLNPPYGPGLEAIRLEAGRLSGEVRLVLFGGQAARLLVAASSASGPVIAFVPAEGAAIEATPSQDPCAEYASVRFDAVPVAAGSVLLEGAAAAAWLARVTATQRLLAAAEIAGAASRLLDLAVEHSKNRRQFGRPIGGFQALRHILARMAQRTIALENLVDAALADAASDAAALQERSQMALAYAAEVGRSVGEDSLQVHGGIGFTAEHPLHLYLRRVLSLQGRFGEAAEILAELGGHALRA